MWNRFLLNSGSFRTRFVGASLTLTASALLAVSCSSSSQPDPNAANAGGAGRPSTGNGGAGGATPAQCLTTLCAGVCVDTKTNAQNCGMCGKACTAEAPYCSNSACTATCPGAMCGGVCVDTTTNPANCGGCGVPCGANQVCTNSMCVTTGGGSAGAGGTTGGGGATSSGGSGSAGAPPVIPANRNGCALKPGLISDFEEGAGVMDPVVIANEGRTGTWGIFNDKSKTTQTMKVEASGGTADCDKFALHVTGSGYTDYVGFGMTFAGTPEAPVVYNATAKQFTGIKFKAKAGSGADTKSPVRLNISTPFTEAKDNPGGACVDGAKTDNKAGTPCYQHLGSFLIPGTGEGQLGSSYKTYTYCFDRDLYPLSLPSNVSNANRDATGANLLKLQFQFNQGRDYSGPLPANNATYPNFSKALPFDFWVDDVEFITGDCMSPTTPSPSNNSPAKPFPQNTAVGSCMPATNAAKFNSAIAQIYANWTKTFVQNDKIVAPEQSNHITSEAMGYGMMIAAAMGDKTAFDKFAGYVASKSNNSLMDWREDSSGSASDADLDIAYAYLMANLQWPSGGYKTKSDAVAGRIASADLSNSIVTGGSQFQQAAYNPSYFAPAWMRKLTGLSSHVGANYTLVNANVTGTTSGIPTDWADKANGKPAGSGPASVTSDIQDPSGAMGYDAARVPWRLGMDACLNSSADTAALKAIVSFFAGKYDSGATIDLLKAGWIKGSGTVHPKAANINMQGSFIGPMGVGGMATGNTAMRDRAFRTMLDILQSGDYNHTYFPSTVGLLSLLAMSGNFPTP